MGSYNYYKMFGCFNRKFKISESEPPPDVREAFSRYAQGAGHMTGDQLLRFLVEHQGQEGSTLVDAETIMQQVNLRRHHGTERNGLGLEDFFYFLFQDDLNGPINLEVHHDMTAPLQNYFIYTGHNSYLTGNQLSSDCSEIPIIRSLENGVRGIELDLWPNSGKYDIHVLHGRTLTTPVPLVKCFKSIKEHAFVKSPYPVIVTLEDHLTPDLQAKVAEMATQIFGDMLYCPESGILEEFPSPEALKHKIILSTKPPKEYLGGSNNPGGETPGGETPSPTGKDSSDDDPPVTEKPDTCDPPVREKSDTCDPPVGEKSDTCDGPPVFDKSDSDQDDEEIDIFKLKSGPEYKRLVAIPASTKGLRKALRIKTDPAPVGMNENKEGETSSTLEKDSSDKELSVQEKTDCTVEPEPEPEPDNKSESDQEDEDADNSKPKSGNLAAPQYKRIIAIHAGNAKKTGIRHSLRTKMDKASRLSLSEQELEKAASLYTNDVVRFTQKNILRVFPKGTRVTSSNFRPVTGWMHGAQMVAFNMQGYGKSLWMMHGLFRSNGGCGYVKKPDILMIKGPNGEVFDPKLPMPVRQTLKVTVYMGDGWRLDFSHTHFDAYSPPDFYTKIFIVGVPSDGAKRKTRIIGDDWTPFWDEEYTFPLRVPEIALLRIEVREHDISEKDDFGGQTCLPVSELRPGIRSVPLYDRKGQKFKSVRLLMRFQFD